MLKVLVPLAFPKDIEFFEKFLKSKLKRWIISQNYLFAALNRYIKDVLHLNIISEIFLSDYIEGLNFIKFDEEQGWIEGNFKVNDYNYLNLLQLIEFGNLEVRGTYIISKLEVYIKANLNLFKFQYENKGKEDR